MVPTLKPQIRSEESQVRTVLAAVRRIMHAADLRSRRLARETGLTAPQLAILQAIADLGEVTTGRISADVSLSQPTVTVILDRLVERDLVERYRSADDRRIVHSRLTIAGKQALAAAEPAINTRLVAEFKRMQASEQAELVAALEWIAQALGGPDEAWQPAEAVAPTEKF
ncbi:MULTISPECIES: MarR family transcriptional regulator [Rhodopseudomonas]|uniref:MarR family winged helix-turn-helix transcriptional regulator n=1 Tax=Rhodopseudomonas TaxID=1073 RepID=UPI0005CAAFCA|nr:MULTISPECIES: MarR family transcriptional regulator [Rhodopseudomonas]MDF3813314.1 MarR family transcriptional regulator [Rhodopseudomonas sp. BAL398]WOK17221.1 MarR family transcriptional regulator [Rhodopseudomonas sp. BAL398]